MGLASVEGTYDSGFSGSVQFVLGCPERAEGDQKHPRMAWIY